ncbi:MAG: succinate dehydrogenase [Peptococcaceae bacterium]|nr:succinate dehydrogenase [Peptococcaceae bacterium]
MQLQKNTPKGSKAELYLDLIELFTGTSLVLFIWTHMIFVSSILLGADFFNHHSENLDRYYLSYLGIPFVIIIFVTHAIVAGRRIPANYREQRTLLSHLKTQGGTDTLIWFFQVISGIAILFLGIAHMAMILSQWPIGAITSSDRVHSFWWFYLILILLSLYHAGFGIYRQFVKWTWFSRKPLRFVAITLTASIFILSIFTLLTMYKLGGSL